MTPLVMEWVEKAEGDFVTGGRERHVQPSPNYDAACFHSQQCAEKYLKACLQNAGIAFPRTHDLKVLLSLLLPLNPQWSALQAQCNSLTEYAVASRYPGTSADYDEANNAVQLCQDVRIFARSQLGLT